MQTVLAMALAVTVGFAPRAGRAQVVIARDGWEAFPNVGYEGGDATQPKKRNGVLVLTDSTLGLYQCHDPYCEDRGKYFVRWDKPFFIVPLRQITEVSSSSQVRGSSVAGKLAFGLLANDRAEEYFGFVYESATSAESPVFKVQKTQSGALEAKVKFRQRKLGMTVAPADTLGSR